MIKVKICGITNLEDAKSAVSSGADALGFVFYRESPRFVEKETVKQICRSLPPFVSTVGVFVNEDIDTINAISEYCSLDIVQVHGDESVSDCQKIRKRVIKTFRVKDETVFEKIKAYHPMATLLDTFSDDSYGGTGQPFDWSIASKIAKETPIILSGGLTCENILTALKEVCPFAVDVSSGVEKAKGKKDYYKLKKFIELIKSSNW